MSGRRRRTVSLLVVTVAGLLGTGVSSAAAKPILMPTLSREIAAQHQIWSQHVFAPVGKLQPPGTSVS